MLAAVLARRGIRHVIGTDLDPGRCSARARISRVSDCRPGGYPGGGFVSRRSRGTGGVQPTVDSRATQFAARAGIYDPDSRMLHGFLNGLPGHLEPQGEGWLILSDLAEHLGLRSRDALLAAVRASQLQVLGRQEIRPRHSRTTDRDDPLYWARAAEVTSLWRLAAR